MKTVIIHGKRLLGNHYVSPRHGRPACELWGIARANPLFWLNRLTDWTRWADLHPLVTTRTFPGIAERFPEEWRWMQAQDGTRPIYLQAPEAHPREVQEQALRRFEEIPGAVRFPLADIQARYPIDGEPNRWFVDQTALLIAFACVEGFTHIILNGVGQSRRPDFILSHLSHLYWLAFARGLGVTVTIEGPSFLHTPDGVYAYDTFNHVMAREAAGVPHALEYGP
jgi:hypothetical protein